MNVQEAAKRLKKSEPTIRRWIRDGKLKASMLNGVYDIPDPEINERLMSGQITEDDQEQQATVMRANIQSLERQLKEKDEQIENLRLELKQARDELRDSRMASEEASHRHDTVVMQMTKLLEYHQQPFWRKLFLRKALPPPVEGNVVNMETQEDKEKNGK